jgi:hypothetical protein
VASNPGPPMWQEMAAVGGRRTEAAGVTGVYEGARAGGEGEDEVLGGSGGAVGGAGGGTVALPMAGRLAASTRRTAGPWREREKKRREIEGGDRRNPVAGSGTAAAANSGGGGVEGRVGGRRSCGSTSPRGKKRGDPISFSQHGAPMRLGRWVG